MDDLADRNLRLDSVQKSNEFLMTMALHIATDDRAVEDVESGEQRRRAVPFVIVCHGSEPAFLQRQARLGAIEGLIWLFSSTDSTMAWAGGSPRAKQRSTAT